MNSGLRENKSHGTADYPYSQYTIRGTRRDFQVPVHWHDEMEVIYVRQGQFWVNVAGEDHTVKAGEVLIISPQQLHLMGSEDGKVSYCAFLFPLEFISFQSNDELERTVFKPLRTGQRALRARVDERALTEENLALLERLTRINESKPPMYQLESRVLLLRFLTEVLRCTPMLRSNIDEAGKMQRELLEYIRIHYRERITLGDLAQQFHLSPKYLSRYFKEHFHLTMSDYIGHLRMEYARELLEDTDLSVTEIASRSGFSGVSFFIRSFTRLHGCPPLKWRKRQEAAK